VSVCVGIESGDVIDVESGENNGDDDSDGDGGSDSDGDETGEGGGRGNSKISTTFEYPLLLILPPPKNILF
jgi:hypothetical protein